MLTGNDSNKSFETHPGFIRLVELLNKNKNEIRSWVESGTLDKKSILWDYVQNKDPPVMSKDKLVEKVIELNKTIQQLEKDKAELQSRPSAVATITDTTTRAICTNTVPAIFSVRSILLLYRHDAPMRHAMKEVSKLEKKLNATESTFDGSGDIYAAWNPLMANLHKLGFTHQQAEVRVRLLQTAGVLEPFQLICHARVPDAR